VRFAKAASISPTVVASRTLMPHASFYSFAFPGEVFWPGEGILT
jgi:hypothetical protein